jgi:phenylalanyl-tRNA synthetase alpha subunit
MMGAETSQEGEDSSKEKKNELKDKMEDLKENISEALHTVKDSTEEETQEEKVIALIEHYRKLDDREQAIKTAQVMKGYIERLTGAERELTYNELSEKLSKHEYNSSIERMEEFFRSMGKREYSGKLVVQDMDEVVKAAKNTVDTLSQNVSR